MTNDFLLGFLAGVAFYVALDFVTRTPRDAPLNSNAPSLSLPFVRTPERVP